MRENVSRVLRGEPAMAVPPVESREPRPELPLLTRTLAPEDLAALTVSAPTPWELVGRPPPPTG